MSEEMLVFSGSGSPELTQNICSVLGIEKAKSEVLKFSDGNLFVRVQQSVRGSRVFLVQSTGFHTNDNFMELVFWIDAFKRASASMVTVIMPYFSYAKGDKKDEPRVSIRARVCADMIEAAGADRVVTLDLHAAQIQGFFKIPVDDLYGMPILVDAVQKAAFADPKDMVVVSPDAGFVKKARDYADKLGCSLAIGDKQRKDHSENAEIMSIIGDVEGKVALLVDDIILSGGTLIDISQKLLDEGAKEVYAAVTHAAIASDKSIERLIASPIKRFFVTDSIETQPVTLPDRFEVVSNAPLFADAISRIHNRESISVLFND